jgi:lipopolysaccharide/colanic/teichoic acid biosynthesis glycosyltransferase/glycosyltransferase involved in cell wall biosynthesis
MISVIIPAKDAAGTIEDCLRGVHSQRSLKMRYEVILVDDGSTDHTAEIAGGFDVKVIRQENAGRASARNAGALAAQGDILAFTDADCIPSPEWLHHLVKPFDDPAVVGCKGVYRTLQKELVPRFVQQEYGFKYLRMKTQDSIDFIDTYSAAYRRDVFMENKGFENAMLSVEDQEFSFRLARKGYRLVFVPDAIVHHQHVPTTWRYLRRKFEIGYWKAFMLRWLPEKTFGDSHTPATLRWQILFLALTLTTSALAAAWRGGWWLPVLSLGLFYLSTVSFTRHIAREDRKVLVVAPWLLLLRAGGLGFGLVFGLVFPPRTRPRTHTGLSPLERGLKRSLDTLGALVGLVVNAPVLLICAVAIKLDSPGSVFYSQERAGENGRPFRVHKLRTMVDEAEDRVGQVLSNNSLEGPVYKVPSDPRVTRVGRFIRRWSLDEIPQFWNVLKGEMSLVGPRPEELWIVANYNDSQRRRLVVKPGLTGPMQISGRGELSMPERLALEVDYIDDYSFLKDIAIILRTIPAVLSGRGAF